VVYKKAELNGNVDSENKQRGSSTDMYYIGSPYTKPSAIA
jgi:hypothetical protein